jgi:hypothetical protein
MCSPTRSIVLLFPSLRDDGIAEAEVQLGAVMDVGDRSIRPGSGVTALLTFWSDLGRIYATEGSKFRLWYAGRVVGQGGVLSIEEERA